MSKEFMLIGMEDAEVKATVSLDPVEHIIASTLGGSLTAISVCPLDVIKTRLQAQTLNGPLHFHSTMDALSKIVQYEGVFTLWRGLVPTLLMTVPATTLYFISYEKWSKTLSPYLGIYTPTVSGSLARVLTAIAACPLDMFRTFLQSNSGAQMGIVHAYQHLLTSGDLRNLWTGLVPTLWRDVPFSAIYWTLFEYCRKHLPKSRNSFWTTFCSGAISGTVAAALTTPFDVLKTRRQMNILDQKSVESTRKVSLVTSAKKLYFEEGAKAFFKGILPRTIRVAPACAIMISSYEAFKIKLSERKYRQTYH